MIKGLEYFSFEEKQRELRLFSLETRRLSRDLINVYKYLIGRNEGDRSSCFSVVPSDRTRGNRHKMKNRKFPLNVGTNLLLGGWSST